MSCFYLIILWDLSYESMKWLWDTMMQSYFPGCLHEDFRVLGIRGVTSWWQIFSRQPQAGFVEGLAAMRWLKVMEGSLIHWHHWFIVMEELTSSLKTRDSNPKSACYWYPNYVNIQEKTQQRLLRCNCPRCFVVPAPVHQNQRAVLLELLPHPPWWCKHGFFKTATRCWLNHLVAIQFHYHPAEETESTTVPHEQYFVMHVFTHVQKPVPYAIL